MLAVLSPAKKLDLDPVSEGVGASLPRFDTETAELIRVMRQKSVSEIAGLMSLSDNLATLNHERYATFDVDGSDPDADRKQAALVFAGDTYQGLDAPSLSADDLAYADEHVRILSGLYGVLRPLDLIQPYRLEMGTKLETGRGANLYEFWGPRIAEALNEDLAGDGVVLNLASVEYSKAIDRAALKARVITPVFKEMREGGPKVISFVAKRTRGAMARWMVEERVDDPVGIPAFDVGGYAYDAPSSTPDTPVFIR